MVDIKIKFCDPVAFNELLRLRRDHKISWRAVGLGMVIANFANKDGEAWPSRATLAEATGIELRDISRVTAELADTKFLAIEERDGRANIYRLTLGEITQGGKRPLGESPLGDLPPTLGRNTPKPLGDLPPITIYRTIKEQYAQNAEKPPRRSASADERQNPNSKEEPKGKSSTRGNQNPSPTPSRPKVTWDGTRIVVPDVFLESWRDAYPCVDLDMAVKRASSWCLSNPGKRPKKDFTKFLNGWLGRVKPSSPEYMDPKEQMAADADLIRQAEDAFPDPDERADFFYQRSIRGLRVPPGVDCRPMPTDKEVAI